MVLDAAAGFGAGAAKVVVTVEAETGSYNAAAVMTECMPMCSS